MFVLEGRQAANVYALIPRKVILNVVLFMIVSNDGMVSFGSAVVGLSCSEDVNQAINGSAQQTWVELLIKSNLS